MAYHPHHLQKLILGEYSFFHKRSGNGFLLDYLKYEEFLKVNDLVGSGRDCHPDLLRTTVKLKLYRSQNISTDQQYNFPTLGPIYQSHADEEIDFHCETHYEPLPASDISRAEFFSLTD